MHLTVQKWGNSLALRIPKVVAQQINVRKGSHMDMSLVENKIILSSSDVQKYQLKGLLKKVSKANLHKEFSWGKPLGKEAW